MNLIKRWMNFGEMAGNPRRLENTINYATERNPEPCVFQNRHKLFVKLKHVSRTLTETSFVCSRPAPGGAKGRGNRPLNSDRQSSAWFLTVSRRGVATKAGIHSPRQCLATVSRNAKFNGGQAETVLRPCDEKPEKPQLRWQHQTFYFPLAKPPKKVYLSHNRRNPHWGLANRK